jgi:hypothetical protein
MDVGPATLKAWSMQPFFSGFDESRPEHVVSLNEPFQNAVANAGLSFTAQSGNSKNAFELLREAVDHGQTPVIFLGKWMLVTGYDTVAQLIFVQDQGAQVQQMPLKQLMETWSKSVPTPEIARRKPYTFLSFQSKDDNPKVTVLKSDRADKNQAQLFLTPTFEVRLQPLSRKNAQRRTISRAAALLTRAHFGKALLNVEALHQLARELSTLGTLPPSPVPVPEANSGQANLTSPIEWQQKLQHAQTLAPWFDAPLNQWIEARRDGATYLESVGREMNDKKIRDAATELRHSIMALQNASADFPDGLRDGSITLWTTTLEHQLQRAASDLQEAETAEKKAAMLMQGNS